MQECSVAPALGRWSESARHLRPPANRRTPAPVGHLRTLPPAAGRIGVSGVPSNSVRCPSHTLAGL